ncbi:MAG: DUF3108 domain-containing protein [Burkholderiales bacterium]|nr:DUF3108 domain-containing protein [Burkholderiales bacterium]
MIAATAPFPLPHASRLRRGALFFLAALGLHAAALQWLAATAPQPLRRAGQPPVVSVHFRAQPDTVAAPARTPAVVARRHAVQTRPAAAAQPPAMPDAMHVPASVASKEAPATADAPAASLPEAAAAEVQAEVRPPFSVSAPPSVQLSMQLIRTEPNRNPLYGVGNISWEVSDNRYRMQVEAGLDLLLTSVQLYRLRSEGSLGRFGIAPATTTETRRSRSETATHFRPQEKSISFSSSADTVALADGAQDKASVLMQLAGIGRADPAQFVAGREIAIQVAEEREAATFVFVVSGQEEIDTRLGKLLTWRLERPPRPGSYRARLEIWLAPGHEWYPVQIRNTEANGAVTTQTVTKITVFPEK